jgi:MerR family mercuric resistance operon transcriptional regulator
LGFSLDEVRALLRLADDPVGSCEAAHDLACRHLAEVRAKISDLKAMARSTPRSPTVRPGTGRIAR